MKKNLREILGKEIIILDGAMGTALQKYGLKEGERPDVLSVIKPELVQSLHKSYVDAGAMIISTNTFVTNRYKLKGSGFTVEQVVTNAVAAAKAAAGGSAFVALDVGPIGEMLAPAGSLSFGECIDIFKEIITHGANAGVDLIFIETIFDLYELKAAVLAAKESCNLPVFASMTFQENARTFTGCPASAAALLLDGLGVDAIGVNCSLGPAQLYETVKEIASFTSLPLIVKPNAGLPNLEGEGSYNISPEQFAAELDKFRILGASIFGGCCGTTPEYIQTLSKALSGKPVTPRQVKPVSAVCSGTKTVILDSVKIIGERINPTGKSKFKEALVKNDMNYILKQGLEQTASGAEILDVNVGMPGIDEAEVMKNVVFNLQSITDAPLQIDSSNPECIEAGLRVYNGKPIVNSVNGEEASMERILPVVKKYGAAVVALTLDEKGIPKDAEGRFKIAERILKRAMSYGIKKEDVFIDCLTLTVSAEPDSAVNTLLCLKLIKERLGLKTVLGVSNISFGLPERESLNRAFLNLAIGAGLDLPIINPNAAGMTDVVFACNALLANDENCSDFIKRFSGSVKTDKTEKDNGIKGKNPVIPDVSQAIISGLKNDAANASEAMLKSIPPMEIINNHLIPALDTVGEKFDTGEIFLPQLLQSADAAKSAFDAVKRHMEKSGETGLSKGKILLATVKGDIHDIGKNIVKAVLENYGYEIIDLGRDVPPEDIVKTVIKEDLNVVGLSALMTTTLASMEKTIKAVKDARKECKIIVGGAVLTEDYAKQIGADYYAKDAKAAVDYAKIIIG